MDKVNKVFDKFYEVDNNAYYYLTVSDRDFIATESFELVKGRIPFIKKMDKFITGFKMLELKPSILMLFECISALKVTKEDAECPDMTEYEELKMSSVKKKIQEFYRSALNLEVDAINEYCDDAVLYQQQAVEEGKKTEDERDLAYKRIEDERKRLIELAKQRSPLNNSVVFTKPNNAIIEKTSKSGYKYLFTDKVTNTLSHVYLYTFDIYGTLIIYMYTLVKDRLKVVNSFIYNVEIINGLLGYYTDKYENL